MATKSPLAKALKGNQGKLPQALQDAIKAAPESPAKQTLNAKPPRPKMQKKLRKRDPNKFTETYNAATGSYNDPSYHFKKAELYKKNAIKRYGSLEESRKAYGTGESPAKNYKDGYYGK